MHQIPMLTLAVLYVGKELFVGAVQKLGRSSDIRSANIHSKKRLSLHITKSLRQKHCLSLCPLENGGGFFCAGGNTQGALVHVIDCLGRRP